MMGKLRFLDQYLGPVGRMNLLQRQKKTEAGKKEIRDLFVRLKARSPVRLSETLE